MAQELRNTTGYRAWGGGAAMRGGADADATSIFLRFDSKKLKEPRYDVVLHELATRRGIGNQLMEEGTSGEQPKVAIDIYLDAGSAAGRLNTSW
ncbi:hypothetical protein F511_24123 [Dorcoceras hygrometricum]|uniref:Uncharacterized protein n=1 Tax=Dorcoceras hygrometricum TaxID=472368 RepID=A0A2Z7D3D7_9LAMI|nr:hypothetical protein F511_24123 [Dorcoceras hygrometricum]